MLNVTFSYGSELFSGPMTSIVLPVESRTTKDLDEAVFSNLKMSLSY